MGPIHGTVGVAVDLLLFILPLTVVYSLNLPPQKKLGLYLIFLVGFSYVQYVFCRATNTDVDAVRSLQARLLYTNESSYTQALTNSGMVETCGLACRSSPLHRYNLQIYGCLMLVEYLAS